MTRAVLALLVVFALPGDAQRSPGFTRTDSAGITIATNRTPLSALRPAITVTEEPRLRFGAADPPALRFINMRGTVRLPDGRIAVAEGEAGEVRIFDPRGTFLRSFGRGGGGPGEIRMLVGLMSGGGDTLLVHSALPSVLLRFTSAGRYLGATTMSWDSVRKRLPGMRAGQGINFYFRDASVVVWTGPDSNVAEQVSHPTGRLFRPTTTALWFTGDYARSRLIGRFGDAQQMLIDVGGGQRVPVMPPRAHHMVHGQGGRGTRICIAGNERPEVHCVDQDGSQLIVRWPQEPAPTPQSDVDAWKAALRAGELPDLQPPAQIAERIIAQIITPRTLQPVDAVLVDTDRRILVMSPDLFRRGRLRYRVFSADGELLGLADLPVVAVFEMGTDYMLGGTLGPNRTPVVVLHDVQRPAVPRSM